MNMTSKYLIAIGCAVATGILTFSNSHPAGPRTYDDFWHLFVAILAGVGFGAGGKAVTNAMDNRLSNKGTDNGQ